MEAHGTREDYSLWKGTSTVELMRAETIAWKFASEGLDDAESYFVPIDLDQRYPDLREEDS